MKRGYPKSNLEVRNKLREETRVAVVDGNVDFSIHKLNELGYIVCNFYQEVHMPPMCWRLTFRSPFDWRWWQAEGRSMGEAATNALALATKLGRASVPPKLRRKRVREPVARKRVRLK